MVEELLKGKIKKIEEWKEWTLEHKITPSENTKDSIEKSIASGMKGVLLKAKKKPEEYKDVIEEYNKIYAQYGREKDHKKPEERFEEWKNWTLEHKITPSQNSKDSIEKNIAVRMNGAIASLKKAPEKNKDVIEEYNKICAQYGRQKEYKTSKERFEEWKNWTLEHKITPSKNSKDSIEKSIAIGMNHVLSKLKKSQEENKDILEEYNKIYAQYGRQKIKKLQKEKQELLNDVSKLKEQAIKAEDMEKETKEIVDKHINEKSKDRGE